MPLFPNLAGKQGVNRKAIRGVTKETGKGEPCHKKKFALIPTGCRKSVKGCKQRRSIKKYVSKRPF